MDRNKQKLNSGQQKIRNFIVFNKFPPEIRDFVWERALTHERLVFTSLAPASDDLLITRGGIQQGDYVINVPKENKYPSKLFLVNRESHRAAQRFYRVQLPCFYKSIEGGPAEQGILHINPDLDILVVGGVEYISRFAEDFRARDHEKTGLLHLAFNLMPTDAASLLERKAEVSKEESLDKAYEELLSSSAFLRTLIPKMEAISPICQPEVRRFVEFGNDTVTNFYSPCGRDYSDCIRNHSTTIFVANCADEDRRPKETFALWEFPSSCLEPVEDVERREHIDIYFRQGIINVRPKICLFHMPKYK